MENDPNRYGPPPASTKAISSLTKKDILEYRNTKTDCCVCLTIIGDITDEELSKAVSSSLVKREHIASSEEGTGAVSSSPAKKARAAVEDGSKEVKKEKREESEELTVLKAQNRHLLEMIAPCNCLSSCK